MTSDDIHDSERFFERYSENTYPLLLIGLYKGRSEGHTAQVA